MKHKHSRKKNERTEDIRNQSYVHKEILTKRDLFCEGLSATQLRWDTTQDVAD